MRRTPCRLFTPLALVGFIGPCTRLIETLPERFPGRALGMIYALPGIPGIAHPGSDVLRTPHTASQGLDLGTQPQPRLPSPPVPPLPEFLKPWLHPLQPLLQGKPLVLGNTPRGFQQMTEAVAKGQGAFQFTLLQC